MAALEQANREPSRCGADVGRMRSGYISKIFTAFCAQQSHIGRKMIVIWPSSAPNRLSHALTRSTRRALI